MKEKVRVMRIRPSGEGNWLVLPATDKGYQQLIDNIEPTEPGDSWELEFEEIGAGEFENMTEFGGW